MTDDDVLDHQVREALDRLSLGGPPPPTGPRIRRRVRRRRLGSALATLVVLAGAGVAAAGAIGPTDRPPPQDVLSTPPPSARDQLPPGATPLPGLEGRRVGFGVLGPARPGPVTITRQEALHAYDSLRQPMPRRDGQRVFAALVRADSLDHDGVRQGVFWIVSVWFHPIYARAHQPNVWCVDHGVIDARSGTAEFYQEACQNAAYLEPHPVDAVQAR